MKPLFLPALAFHAEDFFIWHSFPKHAHTNQANSVALSCRKRIKLLEQTGYKEKYVSFFCLSH